MIYTRFGEGVRLVRLATLADVKEFERRKVDKNDKDRTAAGWRAIAVYTTPPAKNDPFWEKGGHHPGDERLEKETLVDAAFLKADGGWVEISKAFQALPGSPIRVTS